VERLPPATAAVVLETMEALERDASEEDPATAVDAWLAEDADWATAEDMLEEARATLLEAWAAAEEGADGVVAAAAAELRDDCSAVLDCATACDTEEADEDCAAAAEDAEEIDCTAEEIEDADEDAGTATATEEDGLGAALCSEDVVAGASAVVVGAAADAEVVVGAAADAEVVTGASEETATDEDRLTAWLLVLMDVVDTPVPSDTFCRRTKLTPSTSTFGAGVDVVNAMMLRSTKACLRDILCYLKEMCRASGMKLSGKCPAAPWQDRRAAYVQSIMYNACLEALGICLESEYRAKGE